MRWLGAALIPLLIAACAGPAGAVPPKPTTTATLPAAPSPSRGLSTATNQDAIAGPAGMTLRQEVGAVIMVGFRGPLSPLIVNDWQQHQFGGLILLNENHNATDPDGIRELIASVRSVMAHPLLVATDQEGGTVCLAASRAPCLTGAPQAARDGPAAVQSAMTSMCADLRALGFDIDLAPIGDVWDSSNPALKERSYGQNSQAVAQDVTAAIAGIHAAGMYATFVSTSELNPSSREWLPLRAAVASRVDLVMTAQAAPALGSALHYQGVVISQVEMSGGVDAVRFLENGGDMVMVSHDIDAADAVYDAISTAVHSGAYPRARLDASVQKLLNLGLRFMP